MLGSCFSKLAVNFASDFCAGSVDSNLLFVSFVCFSVVVPSSSFSSSLQSCFVATVSFPSPIDLSFSVYLFRYFLVHLLFSCRPDITVTVDWALNTKLLTCYYLATSARRLFQMKRRTSLSLSLPEGKLVMGFPETLAFRTRLYARALVTRFRRFRLPVGV